MANTAPQAAAASTTATAPTPAKTGGAPDPKASAPIATPEPPKPVDPLEAELGAKFGEKWAALSDDLRAQIISAERKGRDADKKYQAVAKLQKDHDLTQRQAAQLLDALINDPGQVFSNPEIMKRLNRSKLKEFAERVVWEEIQNERMDPKDRELNELRAFRQEKQEAERKEAEAKQKADQDERTAKQIAERRAYWEREIIGALKTQGVEADNAFVAQVARYIQAARRTGQEVDLPRIITQVQSDFNTWQNRYLLSGFKPRQEGETNEAFSERYEKWVSRLDPQIVEMIRHGDLAKLKSKGKQAPKGPARESKPDSNRKMSMSEWLDQREERMRR